MAHAMEIQKAYLYKECILRFAVDDPGKLSYQSRVGAGEKRVREAKPPRIIGRLGFLPCY
jgi:hypothetical protein